VAEYIDVPWSADPEENARVINKLVDQAKREGKKLRWEDRPYPLNGIYRQDHAAEQASASRTPDN
jgi:hypothetical protein